MKAEVKVAAVQMDIAWLDRDANIKRMLELGGEAVDRLQAELLVFPEFANIGYIKGKDVEFGPRYIELSDTVPGPTTEALGAFARSKGVYIVVGLSEKSRQIPGTLYDSAVLIGPTGEIAGVYHKMHIPGEEKHYFFPGNKAEVFKTELGNIGMVICYDLRFPELSRILALKGAEIITCSYNAMFHGMKGDHVARRLEIFAAARAMENGLYVIACNRVGSEEEREFCGHSTIVAPGGEVLGVASDYKQEIIGAALDHAGILRNRYFKLTFQDRRPEHYGPLCELP